MVSIANESNSFMNELCLMFEICLIIFMKRDTVGVMAYQKSTLMYLKNAMAVFVLYDVTDRESFESIGDWLNDINEFNSNANTLIHLIGTKSDLSSERAVTYNEAKEFADKHGLMFTEISAKMYVF